MSAKVGLGEGDGERRIGREVELRVAFSPVSKVDSHFVIYCREGGGKEGGGGRYLITAIFTGAVVLAR